MVLPRRFNMDVVVNGVLSSVPLKSKVIPGQSNYYLNFLNRLGCDNERPPLADLLRHHYQLEGEWLIASPIHWEAGHNDAMLTASDEALELDETESRLWFAQVSDFLKEDGFTPLFHDAHTWLFKKSEKPALFSRSPQTILHQSITPELAALDPSLYWLRLITELQMFLNSHPLNNQRAAKPAINGLWFWGAGEFKPDLINPIFTDDELLLRHELLGKQIRSLDSLTFFVKDALLIIKDPDSFDFAAFENKTKNKTLRWYWNNLSYVSQANPWWSRLWRS